MNESERTVVPGARMESRGQGLGWDDRWRSPGLLGSRLSGEASALVFSAPHSPNYTDSPGTLSPHDVTSAKGYVREHQNPSRILTTRVFFLNAHEQAANITVSEMRTGAGLEVKNRVLSERPHLSAALLPPSERPWGGGGGQIRG